MTKTPKPYSEPKDHVPNPMYQSGVVDTTGTMGGPSNLDTISPLFKEARAAALGQAVDVLDNDPGSSHEHVVLPESDKTRDQAEKDLRAAAKEALKDPQLKTGRSEQEAEAAEKGEPATLSEASGANMLHSGAGSRSTDDRKTPAKKSTAAKSTSSKSDDDKDDDAKSESTSSSSTGSFGEDTSRSATTGLGQTHGPGKTTTGPTG